MLMYLRPYFNEIDASSLKVCILTAEACPVKLMEEWFECAKNVDLYDFYIQQRLLYIVLITN